MMILYQDPQGVVNGHPLTSKGLLMDTLSVVLVAVFCGPDGPDPDF